MILTACQTNVGPEQRGERCGRSHGVFLVAGSRRVVASQWLLDDKVAAQMVRMFCTYVAEGAKEALVSTHLVTHCKTSRYG